MKLNKLFILGIFLVIGFLSFAPLATASSIDLEDGLLKFLKLDEGSGTTAIDYSTNEIDGTLSSSSWSSDSIFGDFSFNANSNQRVNLNNDYAPFSGSISLWAKPSTFSGTQYLFGYIGPGTGPQTLNIRMINNGNIRIDYRGSGSSAISSYTSSDVFASTSEWTHMIITWEEIDDSDTWKIYVDGVEKTWDVARTNVAVGGFSVTEAEFSLGSRTTSSGFDTDAWSGLMSNFGVWDRALNTDEIEYLYASGSPGEAQQPPFEDVSLTHETSSFFVPNESVFTTTSFSGSGVVNDTTDARVNYQIIRERSGTNTTLTDSHTTSFDGSGTWTTSSVSPSSTQQGDIFYLVARVVNASDTDQVLSPQVTSTPLVIENRDPIINNLFFDRGTTAVTTQDIKGFINVNDLDGDDLTVEWELRVGSSAGFGAGTLVDSDTINDIAKNSNVELFTLDSIDTDSGEFYRIDVTVTDDFSGETIDSSVVLEIIDSLADVVRIDRTPSGDVFTTNNIDLVAVLDDNNGGDIKIEYVIEKNNQAFASGTVSSFTESNGEYFFTIPSITSSNTVQEDEFSVLVIPLDLGDDVIGGSENIQFSITNRNPTITSGRFSPETISDNLDFSIFVTPNDLDSDTLSIDWRVERTRSGVTTTIADGTESGITGSANSYSEVQLATVSNTLIDVDDQVRFFATANDGFGNSAEFQSSLLTVIQLTDTLIRARDVFTNEILTNYTLIISRFGCAKEICPPSGPQWINYTFTPDSNGDIVIEELEIPDGNYDLFFFNIGDNGGYFNKTYLNVDLTYPAAFTAELHQAVVNFEARTLFTNQLIDDPTFSLPGLLSAGEHTVTGSAPDFFDNNKTFNVQPLTNTTVVVLLGNHQATLSVENARIGGFIPGNKTGEFFSNIGTFMGSFEIIGDDKVLLLERDLFYRFELDVVPDYATNFGLTQIYTAPGSSGEVIFGLFENNSITINFKNAEDFTEFTELVNITLASSFITFENQTSTGSIFLENIASGSYVLDALTANFNDIKSFLTLENNEYLETTLFFDDGGTLKTFNVVNNQNRPIDEAVITFTRLVNNQTITYGQTRTDLSGSAQKILRNDLTYIVTVAKEGFSTFQGSIVPFQDVYTINLDAKSSVPFQSIFDDVNYRVRTFEDDNFFNITVDVSSASGSLQFATINTTYEGEVYIASDNQNPSTTTLQLSIPKGESNYLTLDVQLKTVTSDIISFSVPLVFGVVASDSSLINLDFSDATPLTKVFMTALIFFVTAGTGFFFSRRMFGAAIMGGLGLGFAIIVGLVPTLPGILSIGVLSIMIIADISVGENR